MGDNLTLLAKIRESPSGIQKSIWQYPKNVRTIEL